MTDNANRGARPQAVTIDTMVPLEMAVRAEQSGVNRAAMDPLTVFVLSLMGGAFVAFGAIFATTVSAGAGPSDYGVTRLLVGVVFSAGRNMVVVGGEITTKGRSSTFFRSI